MAKGKQLTLRVTTEMYNQLQIAAEKDERTVAEFIRVTLRKELKKGDK
jgi:hypothetical protein